MEKLINSCDRFYRVVGYLFLLIFLYFFWKILVYDKIWPLLKTWL